MYRSERLERFFRRHPWVGFATIVLMLVLCVVVLVTGRADRSRISGLPMWLIAVVGIVLFASVGVRYVSLLRREARE